uniref:mitogen-activated protein kinase kinase kinase 7-like n=1 Tax=Fragaria vesca subsp. vesca TaxID=101020 RepID=UPI0005C96295|nr:PREDICTED: mitogen-activated protein kinase kinase kinase 7-like [Fragaria vesca subsp. vesca]
MEQFRHIGEVLGSIKALMVLQDGIKINQGQCCLLLDIFTSAFETIGEEIRMNLKLEEKKTKWKGLDQPLRELYTVFREGEIYIRNCMDTKDWWGKAIALYQNKDCVEFHIHNLFCYFPAVIEAIENAGEIAGLDQDEMKKKRIVLKRKYDTEWNDPTLFQWRFGKQYLVPKTMCKRLESAYREDRWRLVEALNEKKIAGGLTKNEQQLGDLLLKKLHGAEFSSGKLFPSSILVGAEEYNIKRRLGNGRQYKEIHWLGHNFAMRHFFGELEPMRSEISTLLSLSHPNVLQYLCGFYDEDKKECFLVMELMSKDLRCYMKENCGARRQILFSLPVVVDIMLQIARGMEYLHSRKIYHGDLNPFNIFLKARSSTEGFFQAKVSGFGLSSLQNKPTYRNSQQQQQQKNEIDPLIWCAPEVLAEQEQTGNTNVRSKFTENADVYSFGMLCFELLTGKIPFEDSHLQGDKMSQTIRAGGRPLFPFPSPKYLVNLTKRCWQTDPSQRLSFASICRILRYIKKFLSMNPDVDQPILQSPPTDYCEIEAWFQKQYKAGGHADAASVSQIPFQMFSYRLGEKEKTPGLIRVKSLDSVTETASMCKAEAEANISMSDSLTVIDDTRSFCSDARSLYDVRSVFSEAPTKRSLAAKKRSEVRGRKASGHTGSSDAQTTARISLPKLPTPKLSSPRLYSPKLPSAKPQPSKVHTPKSSFGRSSKTNKTSPPLSCMSPRHPMNMNMSPRHPMTLNMNTSPMPMNTTRSSSGKQRDHVLDSDLH